MPVSVRTQGTWVGIEVGPAEVLLNADQVRHIILLLLAANGRVDIVRAHHDNLARGARSPWTADELRDLTHADLEARVAADQAGAWKEG